MEHRVQELIDSGLIGTELDGRIREIARELKVTKTEVYAEYLLKRLA